MKSSILLTLLVGSALGATHLVLFHGDLGALSIGHMQVHGHVQLLGFAGLFVCGVGLHVLPRFTGRDLPFPRLARATVWLLGGGVLLRSLAQPVAFHWAGGAGVAASGALELLGGLAFAANALAVLRGSGLKTGWEPFAAAGAGWLVVACALSAAAAAWHLLEGAVAAPASLTRPFIEAALFGFVLQWIMAVVIHTGPVLWRLGRARWPMLIVAFAAVNAGTLAAATGAATGGPALPLGVLLRALGLVAFAAAMARRPGLAAARDLPSAHIRAGLLWLWIAALAAAAVQVRTLVGGEPPNALTDDALRHLITLGVVAQMIVGMSQRMVPAFGGVKPAWPWAPAWTLWLLNASVVLRALELPAAEGYPALLRAEVVGGPLAYTALALWGAATWATLRLKPASSTGRRVSAAGAA